MHTSSLAHVQGLVHQYLAGRTAEALSIVDIGSYDVNGSYKQFFLHPAWRYTGVDLAAGPNVAWCWPRPTGCRSPASRRM